ncbi:hypothetical protein DOY81_012276 [Sarcophaga bullata]|nr:hypothetical protein DOY81_012276 [Sarcophaga bullata]
MDASELIPAAAVEKAYSTYCPYVEEIQSVEEIKPVENAEPVVESQQTLKNEQPTEEIKTEEVESQSMEDNEQTMEEAQSHTVRTVMSIISINGLLSTNTSNLVGEEKVNDYLHLKILSDTPCINIRRHNE